MAMTSEAKCTTCDGDRIVAAETPGGYVDCPACASTEVSKTSVTPVTLACSRCGVAISQSYEPGRCYNEQSEPDVTNIHDEALPWEAVHGQQPVCDRCDGTGRINYRGKGRIGGWIHRPCPACESLDRLLDELDTTGGAK
jgi:hypothetical protein